MDEQHSQHDLPSPVPDIIPQPSPLTLDPIVPTKKSKKWLIVSLVTLVILGAGITTYVLLTGTKRTTSDGPFKQSSTTINFSSIDQAYDEFYKSGIKEFLPEKKQATLDAYKTLTDGFVFRSTFPMSRSSTLASLAVARLSIDDTEHVSNYRNELYLLALDSLTSLPSGVVDDTFTTSHQSDQEVVATFKMYTDTQLTQEINSAITSSKLPDEVSRNLGLSSTSGLVKYTIIALDFAASSDRQKSFASEHYMFGAEPKMWTESVDSNIYILMANDYAKEFAADAQGDQRHSVVHEFIHAQYPFVLGDLSRTIEERRAELFSGDKSAYYDAKQLFVYVKVFSGVDLLDMLTRHATKPDDFYIDLYTTFGIATANKLVTSTPSAFLSDPSSATQSVQTLTGGSNGVIDDALIIGNKDTATMDARIKVRVDLLFTIFQTKDEVLQDIDNNLGGNYAMPSAAAKMKEYVTAHY